MSPGQENSHGLAAAHQSQEMNRASSSLQDHESLPGQSDDESNAAASHPDEKSLGDDDKTRHHDEEHHDPEPEGPDGMRAGSLTPQRSPSRTRAQSRASSARSRPQVVVPRAQRRGLFARFVVIPEVERPFDYSNKTKWLITLIVALAAAAGPLGSNIMYRM